MIKPGQFSIIPIKNYYIVKRSSWWFAGYLAGKIPHSYKDTPDVVYYWCDSRDFASLFASVERAQEAIKTAIIYSGLCMKNEMRVKRIEKSRKTITVPPWIKP